MKVPSIVDQSMQQQVHPAIKGREGCSVAVQHCEPARVTQRSGRASHLALIVELHPPVCVSCFNSRQQRLYGAYVLVKSL